MTAARRTLSLSRTGLICSGIARCGTPGPGECVATIVYALIDAEERPRYVGRTRRPLQDRLSSHRRARRARWLEECNGELAAWLQANVPAAVPLEEIPDDGDEWECERAWIEKLADHGLYNKLGNPSWSPKRRGGAESAPAAAA